MSKISINAHSSIRIEGNHKVVYIDPYMIEDAKMDAKNILITHPHYDHLSGDDVSKVSKIDTVFVIPKSAEEEFKDKCQDAVYYYTIEEGKSVNANGLHVEAVAAYNNGKNYHPKENKWLGYVIELDGERIYIAGDTDDTEELRNVKCDVAIVPVGGEYTMNPEEAAAAVNHLKPKKAIPAHYGSVAGAKEDGEKFKALVDSGIDVEILIP